MPNDIVEIFSDGACSGNPGPGGWGAILRYNDTEKEIFGGEDDTTNNKMELKAVIEALKLLTRPCNVVVTTDSNYVVKGMTEWISGWKRKDWKSSSKSPVKNVELWKELDELSKVHSIKWKWVKGHNGHYENERADKLANRGLYQNRTRNL